MSPVGRNLAQLFLTIYYCFWLLLLFALTLLLVKKAAYLFIPQKIRNQFSPFQIANAASYGAKAALLYSDPADYALEGGEPQNTYPNKAWLPASGVQRGSLFTMPGSGDPQTPGIAALKGTYRRPENESELPPIPAHPMGYGDAIHFLKRIGGRLSAQQV